METLVVLMPIDNLAEIAARLLAAGREPDTPAVAVQQGTLPTQKRIFFKLLEDQFAIEF